MMRPPVPLIQAIQRRVAVVAIGPSTVRGQGATGVVKAATEYLAQLRLRSFGVHGRAGFRRALDAATEGLVAALPAKAQSWGLARKCLNIFLHDAYYNAYLVRQFRLERAERFYEVPLDRVVVRELKRHAGRGALPRWLGVKYLTPPMSEAFQTVAQSCADAMGIARVHLDTYFWVAGREEASSNPPMQPAGSARG